MNDWTSGYVADIGYTFGYYLELNPQRVKLAFLNAGFAAPEFGTACELGFGQGLSANMHAAASICSWHGTDFNPAQAGFAQELANASGADAHLYDEAFDEFARRDLPEFDYIGLHGIWSWISDENRKVIVEFIRKKLKVGGVLYVSYNTLPGWSAFAPMRHLMTEHAELLGAKGAGIVNRINSSLDFAQKLIATNPLYCKANPHVSEKIDQIKDQNRHYLAHEFFNRDWHPMHFSKMVELLGPAKVQFACSAHYLDHIDSINMTNEQQQLLKEVSDSTYKQTLRDFMVNQQFRRDYWVKGARVITPLEQAEGLRSTQFILTTYRPEISMKFNSALGQGALSEEIYVPLLDLMADYKVRSLVEIQQSLQARDITFAQLVQAVMLLSGVGVLAATQDAAKILQTKKTSEKLNKHLMIKARSSNDISYLASPVTGGGIPVGRIQQLFLLAIQGGKKTSKDWAIFAESTLSSQGQQIMKEGKTLETREENLAEITLQAEEFAMKKLPVLKGLQII